MALRLVLVAGGLSLSQAACQLPAFGPLGFVAAPGPVVCVSQSSLQVGQACAVECLPSFTNVGGRTLFACGPGDVLDSATLQCEPSCVLPPFGTGIIGSLAADVSPCSEGELCRSCTCDVACDASRNFTSGVGESSFVCTSGGLLRGGTLRCFPCILPSSFDIPNLVPSNSSTACNPGAGLPNNTRCDLTCDPNYVQSGNSQFFCDPMALLRGPNMTCSAQACVVPPIVFPFTQGDCNTSTLIPGGSCAVQCDSRHSPGMGDANFYCESLVPTAPTLQCVPNNCTVDLPAGRNYDYDPTLPNACVAGTNVSSSSSCNIACALGFEAISGTEALSCLAGEVNSSLVCQAASCSFFPVLPPGHVPINCLLGDTGKLNATLSHGGSCRVGCAPGYTGSEHVYNCSFGRILAPAPFCVPSSCLLPAAFATGLNGNPNGPHNSSCLQGGSLVSSSMCDVACDNSTFTTSPGTLSYACHLGVLTAQPSAQCVAAGGCALPSAPCLQSQTCSGACGGVALMDGANCALSCVSTYTANVSLVTSSSCVNGTLSPADNFCYPASCTLNMAALGILGGSDVIGCRDGAVLSHNQSCTLGCNSSLQLVDQSQVGSRISCLYGVASVQPSPIANQFCRLPACQLPLSLPVGYVYKPNSTGGCVAGGLLENFPSDATCALQCAQGFEGTTAQFTCSQTGLSPAEGCAIQDCEYAVSDLTGLVAGNTSQCAETSCSLLLGASALPNGTCCDYECDSGYHLASGATLRLSCPSTPTNCGTFSTCTTSPGIEQVRCEPDTCTLSAPLGSHVVGSGVLPCAVGTVLKGGSVNSTCEVQCAPGYDASGTTTYSCSLGVLTANATLVCTPKSCTLPSTLPFLQQGISNGTHNSTCGPSLVLPSGQSCDVGCEEVVGLPGTTSFSCVNGNFSSASIVCLPFDACLLPVSFGTGVFSAGSSTCSLGRGEHLLNEEECSVECAPGYNASLPTDAYTCVNGTMSNPTLVCSPKPCDVTLIDPLVASSLSDKCDPSKGLTSGQNCTLGCAQGYVSTTILLSCLFGSTLRNGSCEEAPCSLPADFPGVLTTAEFNGCNNSGVLSSRDQCEVECPPGYSSDLGTSTYSCLLGNLTAPSLVCTPLPCLKTFNADEVPDNSTGMGCGSILESGTSCLTKCADGSVGESQYVSTCYLGELSTPDPSGLSCTPLGCVLPSYPSSAVISSSVSGCFPGDVLPSGSSCSWRCSRSAFYDLLGVNVFTCARGNFTASASMSCIPFACTVLPFGPDVIGVAEGAVSACNASALLGHGGTCSIGCASLSLAGSSRFSCNAGVLSVPSGVCYNNQSQCVLPFTSPVVGEALDNVFACGAVLNGGSSCRVGCASGYVPNAGSRVYTCSPSGVLTSTASVVCLGAPCAVPDLSAQGIAPSAQCVPAAPVQPGCAYGFAPLDGSGVGTGLIGGRGGGEQVLSCAMCAALCTSFDSCTAYVCSPVSLQCSLFTQPNPSGFPLEDHVFCTRTDAACSYGYHIVVGDVLGAGKIGALGGSESVLHCGICADYCSSLSSCLSYECSPSVRQCNLNTVSLPNGPALANYNMCVKDAVPAAVPAGFLASSSSCPLQCNGSYVAAVYPRNQTTSLACKGGRLAYPSLRCLPRPCTYPSQFPSNYATPTHGPLNRCVLGGEVAVGDSCRVTCAPLYSPISGDGVVTCSLGPTLSVPSLVCAPFLCSPPASPGAYQVSGCPANSSSTQCVPTCATGFARTYPNGSSAGNLSALCPSNGGEFVFSGCVPVQRCSLALSTAYSVSCPGSPPYLASSCSASCAAGFAGTASVSCPPSGGNLTLSGCGSCACPAGRGRGGACSLACVSCPRSTFSNGSTANCTACPQGLCVNQNQTGCLACPVGDSQSTESEGGSGGDIAAGILVPLIIIGLGVAGFFWWKKRKAQKSVTRTTAESSSGTEMA